MSRCVPARPVLSSAMRVGAASLHPDHARRDAIQACVLLVSAQFGDAAGEWLLGELQRFGALGEPEAASDRASNGEVILGARTLREGSDV
jgi:hypothetical protein